MLHVYDNKLHPNNEKRIDELIQKKKYTSGEKDHPALPPTGQTCELSLEVDEDGRPKEEILQLILQDLKGEQFEKLKALKLRRAYINKFVPEDKPYFHQDSDAIYTVLYYSSLAYKDLNETMLNRNEDV